MNQSKDDTGFDQMPDRYKGEGRETVDIMRDACNFIANREGWGDTSVTMKVSDLADLLFEAACLTHYLKYVTRIKDADIDPQKAQWWNQMRLHVWDEYPDPRSGRPNFTSYESKEFNAKKYNI